MFGSHTCISNSYAAQKISKVLFPLRNPMNPETLIFGGIFTSM